MYYRYFLQPEGVEKRDSQSAFVSSSTNLEFPLELPNYVVNGSARVVLSVTGKRVPDVSNADGMYHTPQLFR